MKTMTLVYAVRLTAVLSAWSGTENHLRCPSEALTAAIGKLGEVMQRMQR